VKTTAIEAATVGSFSERVLAWFDRHGRRVLPWQRPATPYRVWVSEIMLQQTQVATVMPYFERFMARFPDVQTLAAASIDEVLRQWSGLGYYARARNMHRAARVVRDRFASELPQDLPSLRSLPGIGRSTAAAILALACNQRHAILDGNVKRVLARHRGVRGWPDTTRVSNRLWGIADELVSSRQVAAYTQAMMDLGALICTRRDPCCADCPVRTDCVARQSGLQHELPTPKPRRALPVRETMMIMITMPDGRILLERRPPAGIWGGLLSFPEAQHECACGDWCERTLGARPRGMLPWPKVRHSFTHFHLDIVPLQVKVDQRAVHIAEGADYVWYNANDPRGGLAAPVKQLIDRLTQSQRGVDNDPYGTVHQAG
jgi:A/G-specific adenine glycosylase